ncbi:hypothetical protein PCE1_003245 [Barthelona sp. PCE]
MNFTPMVEDSEGGTPGAATSTFLTDLIIDNDAEATEFEIPEMRDGGNAPYIELPDEIRLLDVIHSIIHQRQIQDPYICGILVTDLLLEYFASLYWFFMFDAFEDTYIDVLLNKKESTAHSPLLELRVNEQYTRQKRMMKRSVRNIGMLMMSVSELLLTSVRPFVPKALDVIDFSRVSTAKQTTTPKDEEKEPRSIIHTVLHSHRTHRVIQQHNIIFNKNHKPPITYVTRSVKRLGSKDIQVIFDNFFALLPDISAEVVFTLLVIAHPYQREALQQRSYVVTLQEQLGVLLSGVNKSDSYYEKAMGRWNNVFLINFFKNFDKLNLIKNMKHRIVEKNIQKLLKRLKRKKFNLPNELEELKNEMRGIKNRKKNFKKIMNNLNAKDFYELRNDNALDTYMKERYENISRYIEDSVSLKRNQLRKLKVYNPEVSTRVPSKETPVPVVPTINLKKLKKEPIFVRKTNRFDLKGTTRLVDALLTNRNVKRKKPSSGKATRIFSAAPKTERIQRVEKGYNNTVVLNNTQLIHRDYSSIAAAPELDKVRSIVTKSKKRVQTELKLLRKSTEEHSKELSDTFSRMTYMERKQLADQLAGFRQPFEE